MSSSAARTEPSSSRILVLDETHSQPQGRAHEVFEVLGIADDIARVRSPFLFELGEELHVRVEQASTVYEAQVRVRAHLTNPDGTRVTELEILRKSAPRGMVSG